MPYLKARAEKFNVKLSLGLDGSQPKFSNGINMTAKINGIIHIDILKFIRSVYSQYMQSETLSLNEVAKEFLGDTKKILNSNIHQKSLKMNGKNIMSIICMILFLHSDYLKNSGLIYLNLQKLFKNQYLVFQETGCLQMLKII